MAMTISIVVTSYSIQQIKDIQELLNSIKRQSYPNIETMFVVEGHQSCIQLSKKKKTISRFKSDF